MQWFSKEKSRLIKAWQGVDGDRTRALKTYSLGPNGAYFINASVGDILDTHRGGVTTYQDLADIIKQDIVDFGWENYTFERVCDAYIKYLEDFISQSKDFDFAEMEIVFVQNQVGVLDEQYLDVRIEEPKTLEPI